MAIISMFGSKGGVGTSLVATNLGCALAKWGSTLLIDFHVGVGVDDLLTGISIEKDWTKLYAVLDELRPKYVDLTTGQHVSGLKLMRGPTHDSPEDDLYDFPRLIRAVSKYFRWCLVDLPAGMSSVSRAVISSSDVILLVTTADPPALRCAKRIVEALQADISEHVGVVINQITRRHPSTPSRIAASLHLPLAAALPPDPRSVGIQVQFGRACVLDGKSSFGRGIRGLAKRLQKSSEGQVMMSSQTS